MPEEFEVTETDVTEETVTETADAPVPTEVHRTIHKAEVRARIEGEEWLDDLLPAVTVVHTVNNNGDEAYTVQRPSDGRYLSARGFWHQRRYTSRFERNHNFSYEDALTKAAQYALTLVPEGRATETTVRVVNEWVSALPSTDALANEFQVEVVFTAGKGFAVTRGRRYLSKAGAWHRLGNTARFKRNHFFATHEEAVERATDALPSLIGLGWSVQGLTLAQVLAGEPSHHPYATVLNAGGNNWHDDEDNDDYPGYGPRPGAVVRDEDPSWGGSF